jgi:hypothetical protein
VFLLCRGLQADRVRKTTKLSMLHDLERDKQFEVDGVLTKVADRKVINIKVVSVIAWQIQRRLLGEHLAS